MAPILPRIQEMLESPGWKKTLACTAMTSTSPSLFSTFSCVATGAFFRRKMNMTSIDIRTPLTVHCIRHTFKSPPQALGFYLARVPRNRIWRCVDWSGLRPQPGWTYGNTSVSRFNRRRNFGACASSDPRKALMSLFPRPLQSALVYIISRVRSYPRR